MRVLKRFTSVFVLLLVVSLLAGSVDSLANSSNGNHYTYTYDCWDVDRESPDAYTVERVISVLILSNVETLKTRREYTA